MSFTTALIAITMLSGPFMGMSHGSAGAPVQPVDGGTQGAFCHTLLSKAPEGQDSKVEYRTCAESDAQASAQFDAHMQELSEVQGLNIGYTPLMTAFSDANYEGYAETFYAWGDTCNESGYRINTNWFWGHSMSSIRGQGGCNYVMGWGFWDNYEEHFLPWSYIDSLNDNVDHLQIVHRG